MRRNRLIILFVMSALVISGLSVTSGCGRRAQTGQAKVVYHCPMHPTYTSDRPGDCPICGMKLVKMKTEAPSQAETGAASPPAAAAPKPAEEKTLEAVCIEHKCTMKPCPMTIETTMKPGERIICPVCGEVISTANGKVVEITAGHRAKEEASAAAAGPTIMISQEKQQLIGVRTEPVRMIDLKKTIRASGKIAYDPELVVTQEEFIQALRGEDNVKDSPLADVIERARLLTEAARRKLRLLGMSDEQIAELEKTRKTQTNLYLPGKGESVWAYISIYEYEIGLVRSGQEVAIEAVAYPGETFSGKVVSINPVLDAATRTNQVRVETDNPEGKLKPEMFVNARITVDLGERLAVPESAVLDTGLRKIVYLSKEGDILESREITVGQKAGGYYEVVSGLSEGDVVATSGNFLIDSESKLKAAAQSAEHKHGQ